MEKTKLVFLNTLAQISGQLIGLFISLGTFVLLARTLGASTYGQYSIITTYLGFFAVAADWSLYLLVVKAVGRAQDKAERGRIFGQIAFFRLILAVLCLIIGLLILAFFPYDSLVKLGIEIGALVFLSTSFSQLINGVFQAELKLYLTALLDLIYRALIFILVILAIKLSLGLIFIIDGMVVSAALILALGLIVARPYIEIAWKNFRLSKNQAIALFQSSWSLGLNGIFSNLLYRVDLVILSVFATTAIVGVYGLPEKIMEVIAILPGAFIGSVFPIINRYYAENDTEKVERSVRRSMAFLIIMGAFLSGFIFTFARQIVFVAGGSQFEGSVIALQILAFYPLFAFLGNFYFHLAVITDRQKILLWRTGAVLGLNIILNLIFIPLFSYKAAAVITLITELTGAVLSGYIIYQVLPIKYLEAWRYLKILVCAGAVNLFLLAIYRWPGGNLSNWEGRTLHQATLLLLFALIGTVMYSLLLLGVQAISKNDFKVLIRRS